MQCLLEQQHSNDGGSPADSFDHSGQTAVARPVQLEASGRSTLPRRASNDDEEEIDNVNEAHNNYVMLSQPPTSSTVLPNSRGIRASPRSMTSGLPTHGVKVVRLKVAIDKRLTVIDERSPSVLKYKTPHFR